MYETQTGGKEINLKIITWHGESGTLFYVGDTDAPEEEQPAILATFHTRAAAESFIFYRTRPSAATPVYPTTKPD